MFSFGGAACDLLQPVSILGLPRISTWCSALRSMSPSAPLSKRFWTQAATRHANAAQVTRNSTISTSIADTPVTRLEQLLPWNWAVKQIAPNGAEPPTFRTSGHHRETRNHRIFRH